MAIFNRYVKLPEDTPVVNQESPFFPWPSIVQAQCLSCFAKKLAIGFDLRSGPSISKSTHDLQEHVGCNPVGEVSQKSCVYQHLWCFSLTNSKPKSLSYIYSSTSIDLFENVYLLVYRCLYLYLNFSAHPCISIYIFIYLPVQLDTITICMFSYFYISNDLLIYLSIDLFMCFSACMISFFWFTVCIIYILRPPTGRNLGLNWNSSLFCDRAEK